MNDMRKLMNLVEGKAPLMEAKHHRMFDEAMGGLKKYEDLIGAVLTTNQIEKYKIQINHVLRDVDMLDIHPSWKTFWFEYAILMYACFVENHLKQTDNEKDIRKLHASIEKKKMRNKSFQDIDKYSISELDAIAETATHYAGIDYAPLKRLVADNTKEEGFLNALSRLEQEFKQESENDEQLIEPQQGDEIVITFPDSMVWVRLDRVGCSIEGNAMGHCGNMGSPRTGDRVFSLRKLHKNGKQTPSLTFIINNGELGESKGRSNDKPAKRYHKYIIELLKSEYVKRIVGGGYKPENNFNLLDLTKEQRNDVIQYLQLTDTDIIVIKTFEDIDKKSNDELITIIDQDATGVFKGVEGSTEQLNRIYDLVIIENLPPSLTADEYFNYLVRRRITSKNMYQVFVDKRYARYLVGICAHLTRERWPEVEHLILEEEHTAIDYASRVMREEWPELSDKIFKDDVRMNIIMEYIMKVEFHGRVKAAEKQIIERGTKKDIINYMKVMNILERWPEVESKLIDYDEDGDLSEFTVEYIKRNITERSDITNNIILSTVERTGRLNIAAQYFSNTKSHGDWEELKEYIIENGNAHYAYMYCMVMEKRYPELEPIIMTSLGLILRYAEYIIKGRWIEGEKAILKLDLGAIKHDSYGIGTYIRKFIDKPSKVIEEIASICGPHTLEIYRDAISK